VCGEKPHAECMTCSSSLLQNFFSLSVVFDHPLENELAAENKQIAIEELGLLVWLIGGWEKRGRGSLVLVERAGV